MSADKNAARTCARCLVTSTQGSRHRGSTLSFTPQIDVDRLNVACAVIQQTADADSSSHDRNASLSPQCPQTPLPIAAESTKNIQAASLSLYHDRGGLTRSSLRVHLFADADGMIHDPRVRGFFAPPAATRHRPPDINRRSNEIDSRYHRWDGERGRGRAAEERRRASAPRGVRCCFCFCTRI